MSDSKQLLDVCNELEEIKKKIKVSPQDQKILNKVKKWSNIVYQSNELIDNNLKFNDPKEYTTLMT